MNGQATNSTGFSITPIKSGTDTLTFSLYGAKKSYRICVAPDAFAEEKNRPYYSENSDNTGGDDSAASKDILFLGIPWGATYSEAADILNTSGIKLGGLAQRNDHMRTQLDGEFPFANLTANHIALNFSYQEGENDPKENNSFYMGTFYFPEDTSVVNLEQAVIRTYGLDSGKGIGTDWMWQKDHVKVVLSKKTNYVRLELIWDGEK